MSGLKKLVLFRLAEQRYGLALESVERIVRAAEVTPVPNAPPIVHGVIDVAGQVLPVVNLQRRFGLSETGITPAEQFLIARTSRRGIVLVIDDALEVIEVPATELIATDRIVPGLEHIQGVCHLADGLVFIHDLEQCLSLDEERTLDKALEEMTHDR